MSFSSNNQQSTENVTSDYSRRSKDQKANQPRREIVLNLIAIAVTISIFLKALIDVDIYHDTWGYHLPFAARIWNIVPAEQYINMEERFAGFPLFAEFLQGFFWFITNHLQAANLVGFFSIVLYAFFLRSYFRVPLFLSTFSFLAIPLVLTHATSCYVDLPGNIALAISIVMTYVIYKEQKFPSAKNLIVIVLAAAAASNTKPQLEPLVFVVLFFVALRILWLHFRSTPQATSRSHSKWLLKASAIALLCSLLIFATPIKNIALFGNPFYPVRIEIAGKVLNHALPLYNDAPGYLADAPRPQRWLYSILDIKAAPWSLDQWSEDPDRNRMGGFFGAYVVFQVLLLGYLIVLNRDRESIMAAIVIGVMTVVAANFPQSHELRYFMYWMLVLVATNLYLVIHGRSSQKTPTLINSRNLGLVTLLFLAIVVTQTNFIYIKPNSDLQRSSNWVFLIPNFYGLDQFKQQTVEPQIMAQIEPNDKVCLVKKYPYAFVYTPWFHPELGYTYSSRPEGAADVCEPGRKIIE